MIKFSQVTKKFGEIIALDNISFRVKSGEFVFLTGPSGAGKTTVVKHILKEFSPTQGKIVVNGQDLDEISPRKLSSYRRKIGTCFQDFKLIPDRTVFENVSLPLEVLGKKKEKIKKKVEEILELVGLEERADLFPAQLAGGEVQRTCLARAISYDPEILIADEPTGNLDPTSSWQIVKLFKKVNKNKTTVLVATHNVEIVNSVKERVITLEKGKIVKDEKKGQYQAI